MEINANNFTNFGGMVYIPHGSIEDVRKTNTWGGLKLLLIEQSEVLPGYIGYFRAAKPAPAPAPAPVPAA